MSPGDENGLPGAADTAPPVEAVSTTVEIPADTPEPVAEALPMAAKHATAMAKQQRLPNGHFARGNTLGRSRPVDQFVQLCREIADRYKLAQELARMATGKQPYQRVSAEAKLKACELLLHYAYGRPRPTVADLEGMTSEEVRFVYQKRIVGVDQSEV